MLKKLTSILVRIPIVILQMITDYANELPAISKFDVILKSGSVHTEWPMIKDPHFRNLTWKIDCNWKREIRKSAVTVSILEDNAAWLICKCRIRVRIAIIGNKNVDIGPTVPTTRELMNEDEFEIKSSWQNPYIKQKNSSWIFSNLEIGPYDEFQIVISHLSMPSFSYNFTH